VGAPEYFTFRTDHEGVFIASLWLNLAYVSDELNGVAPMQASG
jgi:hypothetical protein